MKTLRLFLLIGLSTVLTNCASTTPKDGVIETSDYILDLGEDEKVLVKEASSTEEDSQ